MAAPTQLSLYNGALRLIGERSLASLLENREPRRYLDEVWNDNAIDTCLEQGQWVFATRAVQLPSNSAITTPFGFANAFDKPLDFIRTMAVCSDPYYRIPIIQYTEEAGFFFCDIDPIYIKYVSNDVQFGGDMSLWPQSFVKYFESYLAAEICERLTQNEGKLKDIYDIMKHRLMDAKSKDAMEQPTKFLPRGSWASARNRYGARNTYDGGSQNTFY